MMRSFFFGMLPQRVSSEKDGQHCPQYKWLNDFLRD